MKKIISILVLVCIFSLYGCTSKASDVDTSLTTEGVTESCAESTGETEPAETEATATEDETNVDDALKAAKTVGEALEILRPDVSFELSDLKYILFDSDDYDGKYVAFRDAESMEYIINTVVNAPIVSYELAQGTPGGSGSLIFQGDFFFDAGLSDSRVFFGAGEYRFEVEEGYFTELCSFLLSHEA